MAWPADWSHMRIKKRDAEIKLTSFCTLRSVFQSHVHVWHMSSKPLSIWHSILQPSATAAYKRPQTRAPSVICQSLQLSGRASNLLYRTLWETRGAARMTWAGEVYMFCRRYGRTEEAHHYQISNCISLWVFDSLTSLRQSLLQMVSDYS